MSNKAMKRGDSPPGSKSHGLKGLEVRGCVMCSEKKNVFDMSKAQQREKPEETQQQCLQGPAKRGPSKGFSTFHLLLIFPIASPPSTLPFQFLAGSRLTRVGGKIGTEKKEMRLSNKLRQAEVLPVQPVTLGGYSGGAGDRCLALSLVPAPNMKDVCQ